MFFALINQYIASFTHIDDVSQDPNPKEKKPKPEVNFPGRCIKSRFPGNRVKHSRPLKKDPTPCCAQHCSGNYSEYRALCRYPNLQLYASLWKAFLDAIVSSFVLALPSFCLDFNTAEILISHLLVAPSYALVSLNTHPRGSFLEGKRRNTQTCLHHSISQREFSL